MMIHCHPRISHLTLTALGCLLGALLCAGTATAADPPPAEASAAETAWEAFTKARQLPSAPAEWRTNRPSPEAIAKFREEQGALAGKAATQAKEFHTRFPDSTHAAEAKQQEGFLLNLAVRMGNTNLTERLAAWEQARLKDPSLTEDERFELRAGAVQRAAMARQAEGLPAILAELEKGARVLQKEFPTRAEPYEMMLEVATYGEPDQARKVAQEIADGSAPEEVKKQARGLLKKMNLVGQKLDLKFTALDGREIELAKLTGKVVLLDFWATWCGPCVAELPNVKAAYDKLSPKGFEIVGISFDQSKEALEKFVAKEKMAWPQYFDGLGWKNKFGQEYGINSIPTMWLIDRKGIVRDLNARGGLAEKVEKLLAETP